LCGEIFGIRGSDEMRCSVFFTCIGLASSGLTTIKWGLIFVETRFFRNVVDSVGPAPCYWIFSGVCLLGGLFVLVFVPETKGRSLEEISKSLAEKSSMPKVTVQSNDTLALKI
jgi:hypothetical protein